MIRRPTAQQGAQIRPMPTDTTAQISAHRASISAAAADGRPAEALDLLADAHDLGVRSPLLDLCRAVLLPAAEDYVEHVGVDSPVPAGTLVAVDLGDSRPLIDLASMLCWSAGVGTAGEGRIRR